MWRKRRVIVQPPKLQTSIRRRRATVKEPTRTCNEELKFVDAEINRIESDIKTMATEYENVRAVMIAGIVSLTGLKAKERMDDLISELNKLKEQRVTAMTEVERMVFAQMCKPEIETERIQKDAESRQFNREQGFCEDGCTELMFDRTGSVDICVVCGAVYDHRLDATADHFAYEDIHTGDIVPRRRGGGYKPPNHFAEIIAQFQGKRKSSAPQDVVDMIDACCVRYHIPKHKITPKVVRMFLKQKQQEEVTARRYSKKKRKISDEMVPLVSIKKSRYDITPEESTNQTEPIPIRKYTDYYKHCPEIAWRLSGIPPPYMMPCQEDKIVAIFPIVVELYRTSPRYLSRKANRTNRVKENPNMLNYLYIMFKICEMLGYNEFLPFIPLPKSYANISDCDANGWKHICEARRWTYTPTARCC